MTLHDKQVENQFAGTLLLMGAVAIVGSNGLLLSPILADVGRSYATDVVAISRAISAYAGATAVSAFLLAPQIDRIGPRRAACFGMATLVAALIGSAMAPNWWMLAAAQAIAGLGAGVILPASYTLATMIAKPGDEARMLGRVLVGWSLSLVAGVPISAYIAETLGWRVSYLVLAIKALVILVGLRKLPERQLSATVSVRTTLHALADPAILPLLFVCLCFSISFYGVYAFLADAIRHTLSVSAGQTGLVVLAYGAGFAAAIFANSVADRIGTRWFMPATLSASALIYVAMAFAVRDFAAIVVVAVVWGVVTHLCLSMIVLLLVRARPNERGTVLGLNSATTYLGAMVGTALAGVIYTHSGFQTLAWWAALPLISATLLLLISHNCRRRAPGFTSGGTPMNVFAHSQFAAHEMVSFCSDRNSGLKAIIVIHSSARGPALGGCRMRPYASEDEALTDVLRLSRGMSYKNALAGLPFGGGKSVIIGDPAVDKTPTLLHAFGRFVDRLGGRYVTAEDSNINTPDIAIIGEATRHIRNLPLDEHGDPSAVTSWGVFHAIKAAIRHRGGFTLQGKIVAVQGLGNVGMDLCRLLHEAGSELIVSDIDASKVAEAVSRYGARSVPIDTVHRVAADIYAPCALGGVLNARTIPKIKAKIIAGAANNQLATPQDGILLRSRGILYCPDYVANAGGVLSVVPAGASYHRNAAFDRAASVATTIDTVLALADQRDIPTYQAADKLAEQRIGEGIA
jgi:leucine dehydrogenase